MNSKQDYMTQIGFSKDGDIYIVGGGNTYVIKEQLKQLGFKFSYTFGWYSNVKREVPASYQLFHFTFDSLYKWEEQFNKAFPYPDTADKLKNIKYINNENKNGFSEFVGNEGDRLTIPVVFSHMQTCPGYYIYTFKNGYNIITWVTKKHAIFIKNKDYLLRASIVKHLVIGDTKTTKVNRCVIKNA